MVLTKTQLTKLKMRIEDERSRILNLIGDSTTEYIAPKDAIVDESDQAKYYYDQAQDIRFRNRELFYLKKLDKSLKKISNDDFGLCDECGENIRFERLFARPTADLCIACKDDAEREEHGNFVGKQSKSIGRTMVASV